MKTIFLIPYIFFLLILQFSVSGQNQVDPCRTIVNELNLESNNSKALEAGKAYLKNATLNDSCRTVILKRLSATYSNLIEDDSAMFYIDKAISLGISKEYNEELADCYGYKSFLLSKKYNFDEAKLYLDRANKKLKKYPNSIYLVGHYYHLEKYYANKGLDEVALKYSDSALQTGIRINDTTNIANLYQNLGVKHHEVGNYQLALKNLLKALEIKENKKTRGLEGSYYTVGICLYKLNDYKLAEEYIQKAVTISEKIENINVNLLGNIQLAKLKRDQENYGEALDYIDKAIVLAEGINSNYQSSEILREKGNIYNYGYDSIQKAEKFYLKAYDYATKGNGKYAFGAVVDELFNINLNKGDYAESKKYLDQLQEVEKTSDNIFTKISWHSAAGRYYKLTNKNDKKALYHYLEYYKLKDSTENLQVKKNLANLEKKYDTNNKELEIITLKRDKNLQTIATKEIEDRQLVLLLIITLTLIALLISFLVYKKIKKQQKALEQSHKEITEINKVKDHLFSIIAHDLRGMILPFQRAGKILTYHIDKGNFEKTITLSKELERNSQSLSDVLNNLLNWSLEQMNSYEMNLIKLSVTEELEEIVAGFKQHSTYKNTEVHLECDTEDILFDKGAFHLIFRNLIGNALKYTENGIIKITAINRDNDVTFTVTDTGVGIAPDKVSKIFSLEKEQSTTGTKGEKGTGLGLNLVKRFVQLHKGKIDVKSREPNGTEFRLIFPNSSPK